MISRFTNFHWGLTGELQTMEVAKGRVLSRGPMEPGVDAIDLSGEWMLPKFVDSHCHILPMGLDMQKLHLGPSGTHETVLDAVRDRFASVEDGGWLLAVYYDQTRYQDGRHLTREDLDVISREVPILLRHVNGHASVANSAALARAGVAEDIANPSGGEFQRDSAGRLTGVLFEAAHEHVSRAVPNPSLDEMVKAILDAADSMAAMGIGTAADMMTGRYDLLQELKAYRIAAKRSPVRFRLYVQWGTMFGPRAAPREEVEDVLKKMDSSSCKVAGIKIFADGAIGSATAAIYGKYASAGSAPTSSVMPPLGTRHPAPEGVSGQLIYSPDKLKQMMLTAHEAGYQVAVHSIGDYSTDLVLDAFGATGEPSRHRIEHAMLLSDAQIERMAGLNCFCSMQPEFLMRFGHSYKRQLGPERAALLNRTRSVKDAGIRLSFSSDRPIVAGDPWDGVMTSSNRPEGFDPSENVTREEALLAYTREGGRALGDTDLGGLDKGEIADFALWFEDPRVCNGKPQLVRPTD